jgi:hypothetical protein
MSAEHHDRMLRRGALASLAALGVALPWPWWLGFANASYLGILAATTPVWLLLAALHDADERATFLRLGAIALAARVVSHLAVFAWASAGGGPYLGPDSTMYYYESQALASRSLVIPGSPSEYFGSYDCAHYFVFAAAQRLLGADLYGLQTLNLSLSAFAGPLFYSAWRTLGLRHAVLLGVGVAVYPSLVALSINDLLKDPSIFAATSLGLWALVRLTRGAPSGAEAAALAAIASVGLIYVRTSRFYVVAFLEAAVIAAVVWRWLRSGDLAAVWRRPAAMVQPAALVLLLVEGLPALAGWPLTPQLLARAVTHSLETPQMRQYAAGLVDQAGGDALERVPLLNGEERSAPAPRRAGRPAFEGEGLAAPRGPEAGFVSAETAPANEGAVTAPALSGGIPQRGVRMTVNGVRKLLGPFPWVPPPAWTPQTVLLGDYLLFPGMLVWYAVFPVALIGLAVVGWRTLRDGSIPLPLVALALFVALLMAQYLLLNLSYRQREFMVPFLAAAALVALERVQFGRAWRYGYGAYWALLAVMAVAHLAVRAALG